MCSYEGLFHNLPQSFVETLSCCKILLRNEKLFDRQKKKNNAKERLKNFCIRLLSLFICWFQYNGRLFPWGLRVKETANGLNTFWRLLQCSEKHCMLTQSKSFSSCFLLIKTIYVHLQFYHISAPWLWKGWLIWNGLTSTEKKTSIRSFWRHSWSTKRSAAGWWSWNKRWRA